MSEFKFACPVCGQHITADSKDTHSEISCPTCYRKIVVPEAPKTDDPKFVLSAAEANKPRPSPATPAEPGAVTPPKPAFPVAVVALAALVLIAGATLFLLRGKLFSKPPPETASPTAEAAPFVEPVVERYLLNLTNVAFPNAPVSGKIHERDFHIDRAVLVGGQLTLRAGHTGPMDLGLTIHFYAREPEQLSGIKVNIATNDAIAPRVVLRWKDMDQPVNQTFTGGYAMRLEFGKAKANTISGKVYICLPDEAKSYVAGRFQAEIRRPPGQKPKGS